MTQLPLSIAALTHRAIYGRSFGHYITTIRQENSGARVPYLAGRESGDRRGITVSCNNPRWVSFRWSLRWADNRGHPVSLSQSRNSRRGAARWLRHSFRAEDTVFKGARKMQLTYMLQLPLLRTSEFIVELQSNY